MITMSNFGSNGRLGNQLFQYAFMFSLSKENNYQMCLPSSNSNFYKNYDLYFESNSFFDCFESNVSLCQKNITQNKFKEKSFDYDINFPNYIDNCDYSGYYQSYKYFKKYKKELIESLKFKQKNIIKSELDYSKIVSIHIRRGDYVNNKTHETFSFEFLNTSKKHFDNKKYLVFSDDIEWCKKMNIGDYYAENNNDCLDLYQMTLCKSSIIANSSFSWWGAYLSEKEKVIAPKKWFNNKNVDDLYCDDWIKL
jgi:hypothetical protein